IPLYGWSTMYAGPTKTDRVTWFPSGFYKLDMQVRVGANSPTAMGASYGMMGGMGGGASEENGRYLLLENGSIFGSSGRSKTVGHTFVGGKLTTITIDIAGESIQSRMKQLAEEAAKPPASTAPMPPLPLDTRFFYAVQNAIQPEVEFSITP